MPLEIFDELTSYVLAGSEVAYKFGISNAYDRYIYLLDHGLQKGASTARLATGAFSARHSVQETLLEVQEGIKRHGEENRPKIIELVGSYSHSNMNGTSSEKIIILEERAKSLEAKL